MIEHMTRLGLGFLVGAIGGLVGTLLFVLFKVFGFWLLFGPLALYTMYMCGWAVEGAVKQYFAKDEK